MKTAYVGGPITVADTRPGEGVVDAMIKVVEEAGYNVFCAEKETNKENLDSPDITPAEIFHKDYYAVKQSDLVVLECTNPSTGNGMEIMLAHEKQIPIIVLVREDQQVSRMLLGTPEITVVKYKDLADLKQKLWATIEKQAEPKYVRPGWDDYYMAICRIVGTRSTCDRLRSGAVLVKDNRIMSTGYNGSPPGLPHCDEAEGHLMEEGHCVRTIHGEHNTILQAAIVPGATTAGATLYTKFSPCIHCAKYIVAAGIKRVVMGRVYRNTDVIRYLERAGIEVDIHKENPRWNKEVQKMFSNGVEGTKAPEGEVKLAI